MKLELFGPSSQHSSSMRSRYLAILSICLLAFSAVAREKLKPSTPEPTPVPRAPQAGQSFDDLELDAYLEKETRRLHSEHKLGALDLTTRKWSGTLPAVSTDKIAWQEVAARAEASTLVLGDVYRDGKSKKEEFSVAAGGFVISEEGVIVTCLHVASEKGTRGLSALTRDGRVFAVREVLAADPENDLIFLQLDLPEGTKLPALPLAREAAPVASPIGVMSHPEEHFWMWTAGVVSRHTVVRDPSGEHFYTTITADFAKGSSGCPVLDESGNAVGVVNNTESIYYEDDGKRKQLDLQMVVRNVTPGWVVRRMAEK